MLEITVNVKAPELAAAINLLAASLSKDDITGNPQVVTYPAQPEQGMPDDPMSSAGAPVMPVNVTAQQVMPQQVIPQQVMPDPNAAAMQQAQQQANQYVPPQTIPTPAQITPPPAVPTTPATYTMEQLAVAATQLVDAGRRADLVNLLAKYGVQALTALAKEQYGAFATDLRAMGAKI